jgi:hypothetical protein
MIDCVKKLIQTELELSQEASAVAETQEYDIFRLGFHELYASLFAFKHKVKDKILRFKQFEWRTESCTKVRKCVTKNMRNHWQDETEEQ